MRFNIHKYFFLLDFSLSSQWLTFQIVLSIGIFSLISDCDEVIMFGIACTKVMSRYTIRAKIHSKLCYIPKQKKTHLICAQHYAQIRLKYVWPRAHMIRHWVASAPLPHLCKKCCQYDNER